MPSFINKTKALKNVFKSSNNAKSNLSELKRKIIKKRKKHIDNLLASIDNKTKINTSKINKKVNKSILGPQKEDIIKDLSKLNNTVKNKSKDIKNRAKNSKINTKKYYDYDDIEYKGMRNIKNFYDYIDEDYYEPIKINNALNNDYIEYQSNGDKDKTLSIEEYVDMIRQYLSSIRNDHKDE